jgi:hypothetical protein
MGYRLSAYPANATGTAGPADGRSSTAKTHRKRPLEMSWGTGRCPQTCDKDVNKLLGDLSGIWAGACIGDAAERTQQI